MAIVLVIAAIILIGIIMLVVRKSGGSNTPASGRDRFRHPGPGVPKPEDKPRATGLD